MNKTLALLILTFATPGCSMLAASGVVGYGGASLFSATDSFILSTPIIAVDALSSVSTVQFEGEAAGTGLGPYYGVQISQDHVGLGIGLRKHLASFLGSDSFPYMNAGIEALRFNDAFGEDVKTLYVLGFGSHYRLTNNIIFDARLSYKASVSGGLGYSSLEGVGFDLGLVF